MNTVQKRWLVTKQFSVQGTSFAYRNEADNYASILATRLAGETVEIFECVANVRSALPVVVISTRDDKPGPDAGSA